MSETFKRYEKKYFLTKYQKEQLEEILSSHMEKDKFCKENEYYLIRNVYYDTDENTLIRMSTNKPVFKEKLRLRKYGEFGDGKDSYYLEVKRKYDGLVYKRRVTLTKNEVDNFINNNIVPEKEKYQDKQILKELEYLTSKYQVSPKTFVVYKRTAYFDTTDHNFRLTFDFDIRTRHQSFDFDDDSYERELLNDGMYLMEVKISDATPLWFARALSKLEIYPSSFSKVGRDYRITCRGL
ncbi:MAG: polyphosphate polymerase domain-containing protein [Acholeplasmatales bacterium]|nr:polyphosphate polymerase domain-containing protein [Acholeplasmatales bacterium]